IASFAEDEEGNRIEELKVPTDYTGSLDDEMVEILPLNAEVMAKGTLEAIYKAIMQMMMAEESSMIVFNTANFTVTVPEGNTAITVDADGHLTSYLADVVDLGDFQGETNVIKEGVFYDYTQPMPVPVAIKYFSESTFRSAPYFDINIDGITLK
ncbi:MAG: hypothetical protein J6R83_01950, partial [Clostridia bacterium]|nr:hypothetical protein [Clostridia bacterium]